jgi:ribosomal protein S18 acetylase RimI-like enzyme
LPEESIPTFNSSMDSKERIKGSTMKIRSMTSKDKPAVMKILHNTPEFTPDEVGLAEEVIDDYLEDCIASGFFSLVVDMEPGIGGYVVYGTVPITDNVWELYWFAVDRNIRGQGIGRKLWETAEENMWRAGARLLVLETSSKSEYDRTNLFYARAKYSVVGRIKDYYMVGDDQITYAKWREEK